MPNTIVNSAYDTSGNGGRKLVQLSNGWLVAVVRQVSSSKLYLYKSEDMGQTFTKVADLDGVQAPAMVANGTKVHIITGNGSTSGTGGDSLKCYSFDVTTAKSYYSWTTDAKNIDTGQSDLTGGMSLAIDSNGVLHAAWASKNSTYPNSFNIRYSKSTDGGVTWASPTQLTTYNNSSGYSGQQPCIVIQNGNPTVVYQNIYNNIYYISVSRYNGTSWGTWVDVYNGSSYVQSNPCAVVDSNGVIHVVWYGLDATDTTRNNIRYSKSTDGSTWSLTKITSGNSYHQYVPSIVADKDNKLYIFWHGVDPAVNGTYYNIRKITNDGTGWSSIQTLTSNTTDSALYPSAIASDTLIGWIWKDQQANAVQFDKIILRMQKIKYWNGTSQESVKEVKRWNGSAWVVVPFNTWNGTSWVDIT